MNREIKLKPFTVTKVITTQITVMAKDAVTAKDFADDQMNVVDIEENVTTTVTRKGELNGDNSA
ncbi:hypothetical protein [Solibacillus isronensis]|uniref:hypothetical protein n=1 Tax=Solibacillus isronensis TaxID=412383 RepID=UPI0039A2EFA1